MIDANDSKGAHALDRLRTERTGWLTTVTPHGQPQTMPVWFLWEDDGILVYSYRTAARNRNLASNPRVTFVLNTDDLGEDLVVIQGEAQIEPELPAGKDHEGFLAKYRPLLDDYGWTPERFSTDYPHPIRIRPTKVKLG